MKHRKGFQICLILLLLAALVIPTLVTADKLAEGEAAAEIIALDAGDASASAESAPVKATWKTAPKITVIEMSGSSVKLTWTSAVKAENYVVYEYVAASKTYLELATVTGTTATLKKATLEKKAGFYEGKHTFVVRPMQKKDGREVFGSYSKKKSFTVKDPDAEASPLPAPKLKKAQQNKDTVKLTWSAQKADEYQIYEVLPSGKYRHLATTTKKNYTLSRAELKKAGGFAGTHNIVVRSMKRIDGRKKHSPYSNVLTFFVEIYGEETVGDFTYKMADDGNRRHVKITGYSGKKNVIQVPATILDLHYQVKVIDTGALANNTRAKTLNLSNADYLADIGQKAFQGCTSLTTITGWPDGLEYIGDLAFDGCTKLASVETLPDNIGIIGYNAFKGVPAWVGVNADLATKTYQAALATAQHYDYFYRDSHYHIWIDHSHGQVTVANSFPLDGEPLVITVPSFVERIGNSGLSYFSSVYEIILPDNLQVIENEAFAYNKALSGITIPKKARMNGSNIFLGCTANLLRISVYDSSPAQDWAVAHAVELARQGFTINTIH